MPKKKKVNPLDFAGQIDWSGLENEKNQFMNDPYATMDSPTELRPNVDPLLLNIPKKEDIDQSLEQYHQNDPFLDRINLDTAEQMGRHPIDSALKAIGKPKEGLDYVSEKVSGIPGMTTGKAIRSVVTGEDPLAVSDREQLKREHPKLLKARDVASRGAGALLEDIGNFATDPALPFIPESKVVSGLFGGSAAEGGGSAIGTGLSKWDSGDQEGAIEDFVHGATSLGMAGLAGHGATHGLGEKPSPYNPDLGSLYRDFNKPKTPVAPIGAPYIPPSEVWSKAVDSNGRPITGATGKVNVPRRDLPRPAIMDKLDQNYNYIDHATPEELADLKDYEDARRGGPEDANIHRPTEEDYRKDEELMQGWEKQVDELDRQRALRRNPAQRVAGGGAELDNTIYNKINDARDKLAAEGFTPDEINSHVDGLVDQGFFGPLKDINDKGQVSTNDLHNAFDAALKTNDLDAIRKAADPLMRAGELTTHDLSDLLATAEHKASLRLKEVGEQVPTEGELRPLRDPLEAPVPKEGYDPEMDNLPKENTLPIRQKKAGPAAVDKAVKELKAAGISTPEVKDLIAKATGKSKPSAPEITELTLQDKKANLPDGSEIPTNYSTGQDLLLGSTKVPVTVTGARMKARVVEYEVARKSDGKKY